MASRTDLERRIRELRISVELGIERQLKLQSDAKQAVLDYHRILAHKQEINIQLAKNKQELIQWNKELVLKILTIKKDDDELLGAPMP